MPEATRRLPIIRQRCLSLRLELHSVEPQAWIWLMSRLICLISRPSPTMSGSALAAQRQLPCHTQVGPLHPMNALVSSRPNPSYSPKARLYRGGHWMTPVGSSKGHTSRADLSRNAVNALEVVDPRLQGLRAPPVMARISAIRTLRG